jgi:HSP20 family protein
LNPIESAIQQVERLYQSVVGQPPPPLGEEPYAGIPPEREPFQFVEEQIERLNQMLGATVERMNVRQPWTPAASFWETPDAYVLQVDLPGVPRGAVQVNVAGSSLEIVGERPAPAIESRPGAGMGQARPRWSERVGGSFRRTVPLPGDADGSEVRASLRDGVLEVRLARRTGAARNVSID